MKKTLTLVIGILVILVILLSAVIALSPFFLNKYREPILNRVGKTIDREIRLGDIRLTLFTGLGLRLTDVTVSNAAEFRKEPMLTMSDLDVKVKFLPLLRGEYQVTRVILQKPNILIEKNKAGLFNFSDMGGAKKLPSTPAEKKKAEEKTEAPLAALAGLMVSELKISEGVFSYYDAGSDALKKGIQIQNLDLALEDVSLDKPIPFSLSFGVNQKTQDIKLNGTVGPIGREIDPEKVPLSLQMVIHDVALNRFMDVLGDAPPVIIEKGKLKAAVDLSGDLGSGLNISGKIDLASLTLNDPAQNKAMVKELNLHLSQDLSLNLKEQKIVVRKADLSLDRAELALKGEVKTLQKNPTLSFQVTSSDIPLEGWDKRFPALAGTDLAGSVKAHGNIAGRMSDKLFITLDLPSPSLTHPNSGHSLLPVQPEQEKVSGWITPSAEAAPPKAGSAGKSSGPILPEWIELKGKVDIAKGSFDTVSFQDLKGNYTLSGNKISITGFSARGFGEKGSVTGSVRADLGPEKPPYQVELQVTQADLSHLQEAFAARKEKIEGDMTAHISLSGAGFDASSLERSLSGNGNFKVDQGMLKNINLEERILTAIGTKYGIPLSSLAGMLGIQIAQGDQTPFDECFGTFEIGAGKVRLQEGAITSKNHGFSASGEMGLNQELKLKARMILRQIGETDKKKFNYYLVDEKSRKYIPFEIREDTSNPKIRVDTDALLKGQAQEVIEEKKEKLKEKLREKIGPQGEELLKPLEKIFRF